MRPMVRPVGWLIAMSENDANESTEPRSRYRLAA